MRSSQIAVPSGVERSSGSRVRLPTRLRLFMAILLPLRGGDGLMGVPVQGPPRRHAPEGLRGPKRPCVGAGDLRPCRSPVQRRPARGGGLRAPAGTYGLNRGGSAPALQAGRDPGDRAHSSGLACRRSMRPRERAGLWRRSEVNAPTGRARSRGARCGWPALPPGRAAGGTPCRCRLAGD